MKSVVILITGSIILMMGSITVFAQVSLELGYHQLLSASSVKFETEDFIATNQDLFSSGKLTPETQNVRVDGFTIEPGFIIPWNRSGSPLFYLIFGFEQSSGDFEAIFYETGEFSSTEVGREWVGYQSSLLRIGMGIGYMFFDRGYFHPYIRVRNSIVRGKIERDEASISSYEINRYESDSGLGMNVELETGLRIFLNASDDMFVSGLYIGGSISGGYTHHWFKDKGYYGTVTNNIPGEKYTTKYSYYSYVVNFYVGYAHRFSTTRNS